MASLESVNIGLPQPIPGKKAMTGIYKQTVTGPIAIGPLGIVEDAVLNRKHHGGPDQAVYLYFRQDYDWWTQQLAQPMTPGLFGENLTIAGIDGQAVAVGDRFTIGDCVLEVTSHRTPCMTLAARMGDAKFAKQFHRAGRPGAYCRVIVPGTVTAGAVVTHARFAGEAVTVSELMALDGVRDVPEPMLRRALAAPVHYKMRDDFEQRLARLF